jgi:2,3-bisphosphoglycerate-independent phosphoglycerate mutase
MTQEPRPRPVVLCVLDGWGESTGAADDAITAARTPVWDALMARLPHARLDASEGDVGLPEGQMGNSEVGHTCLGAGRIVVQDLPRIGAALADGSLAANPALNGFAEALSASGGICHLMGLLSPGGVHSHQDHMAALARILAERGVPVRVHAILDGRDTPPRSALEFLTRFEADIAGLDDVAIATVSGRYYSMDRDKRWERTALAYALYTGGEAREAPTARAAIEAGYEAGENDEFVTPTRVAPCAAMTDGDGIVMANFRADRVRQILSALLDPAFDGFARNRVVSFAAAAGMTEYSAELNRHLTPLFAAESLDGILGGVVADAGLRQLRLAETEKYAHVTYFFNGGDERVFDGEERILVASPKVATYDLQPEMSADEVTDKAVKAIAGGSFDLIVMNYANSDMVGHTGVFEAAVAAVETVDGCLGRLVDAVEATGGALMITADHGNVERMRDGTTDQAHTAHTLSRVPVLLAGGPQATGLRDGRLADVAPTLLALLGLAQPDAMTGASLLSGGETTVRGSGDTRAALG